MLYKQDFAGLDTCEEITEIINQKKAEKEKHKENRNPLYSEGPPLFREGHKYLFQQGPAKGDLPPGMRPSIGSFPNPSSILTVNP